MAMYLVICTITMVVAMVLILSFGRNIIRYEEMNDKP